MTKDWRHYVSLSDLYYHNAEEADVKGEFSKATELLWGAIATGVKAVAAAHGKVLTAHRQGEDSLERFVLALARVLDDEVMVNDFADAQAMHRNFYEGDMPTAYRRKYFALTRRLLASLYKGLPVPSSVELEVEDPSPPAPSET